MLKHTSTNHKRVNHTTANQDSSVTMDCPSPTISGGTRLDNLFRRATSDDAPRNGCIVIGEVGQAHDGSLGTAHAYVDAIANAGADVIKFQTHIASAESTLSEPWRIRFSRQDKTRYDYWKRMEFTEDQWRGLREHTEQRGLAFVSSPFSLEAAKMLRRIGVAAWKIASGEVNHRPLLDWLAATSLPVLLSTGMSSWQEIDSAVQCLKRHNSPLAVLQCTSGYPCPPERIGLNLIPEIRHRYQCPVGYSDHSGTIYAGLAAAAASIDLLEVHVTLSREMFGPDVSASVTTSELRQLVEGIRYIERINEHPVDKDAMARELQPMRELFNKSLVASRDLPVGTIVRREDLVFKKPGLGIPAGRLNDVLNRKTVRPVVADSLLHEDDLEG